MTEIEQKIAIAKACGWTTLSMPEECPPAWTHPVHRDVINDYYLPDYLNDLNAMHEAEAAKIALDGLYQAQFCHHLFRVLNSDNRNPDGGISEFDKINATAAQRAEAFLKTLNLYK